MFLIGWPGGSWQATAVIVAIVLGTYIAAFWLALVFWTARDIRQRTSSIAAQIAAPLLVLFLFLPGLWLYIVLRPRYTQAQLYARMLEEEALRLELDRQVGCPACGRSVKDDYLVCPACMTTLKEPCARCSKPLANAWVICPYCGTERPHRRKDEQPARERREAAAAVTSGPGAKERAPKSSDLEPETLPLGPVPAHPSASENGSAPAETTRSEQEPLPLPARLPSRNGRAKSDRVTASQHSREKTEKASPSPRT